MYITICCSPYCNIAILRRIRISLAYSLLSKLVSTPMVCVHVYTCIHVCRAWKRRGAGDTECDLKGKWLCALCLFLAVGVYSLQTVREVLKSLRKHLYTAGSALDGTACYTCYTVYALNSCTSPHVRPSATLAHYFNPSTILISPYKFNPSAIVALV